MLRLPHQTWLSSWGTVRIIIVKRKTTILHYLDLICRESNAAPPTEKITICRWFGADGARIDISSVAELRGQFFSRLTPR